MPQKKYNLGLTVALFVLLGLFALAIILGNSLVLADSWVCTRLLGCNSGFFGYDSVVEHCLAGLTGAVILIWFGLTYPRLSVLRKNFLKNLVIVVATVALIGIVWEVFEFGHDYLLIKSERLSFKNQDITLRNYLSQPSSADTVGDLSFDLLGGFIGGIIGLAISHKKRA